MPSTIFSSDSREPGGGRGGGRAIDYTQNGTLWVTLSDNALDEIHWFRSTDGGVNWSEVTEMALAGASGEQHSFFIDKDNNIHLVYIGTASTRTYRLGIPNNPLNPTSYTWGTPLGLITVGNFLGMEIVAHREGTGWKAHIIHTTTDGGGPTTKCYYDRVNITSGYVVTSDVQTLLKDYGINNGNACALDFRHEQTDPKAVQSATPSVYVAYHEPGGALFFKKIAYSAGVWTPGVERTIDASAHFSGIGTLSLIYDGTRIAMTHQRSGPDGIVRVDERDEADTTTTNRNPTALTDGAIQNMAVGYALSTQDMWVVAQGDTSDDWKKIRFNRGAGTWAGAWTVIEADTISLVGWMALMRGMVPGGSLGVAYFFANPTPNQAHYEAVVSGWEASAFLQGVATTPTVQGSIGHSALATLQGVATVSSLANLGLNPSSLLQGVGTLAGTGLYVPALDFTVYDGYIVDPVNDSFIPLIYHDSPDTPKRLGSIKLRPPRQDTGLEPTEVRPETGETFSQQDFSHGAGQLYYHHEGRDVRKFLWEEGYELDIDTVGQPAILRHLHDVPAAAFTATQTGQIEIFNDLPFAIDGTLIRRGDGIFPGSWPLENPAGAEVSTTVNRLTSSGEFLYAALGVNGIHRRDTSGAWTHWSDVQATRVAWVKNRIIASDGKSIYEVVLGGAAPPALETLPAGWSFERAFEAGGFIYAVAINGSSSLSRIHTYGINAAGTGLEKKNETPFPRNQVIRSGRGYLGSVYLGGGIKTVTGGYDPVVYQAFPQDDGSLTYAKIAEGEGAGAQDLSVLEFEPTGEDVLFGWSLGSGFPYGSRDGLAVHKLKTGAFLPHLKKTGAGAGRQVVGLVSYRGRTLFSLKGDGLYYEDPNHFVADAYLISSVADWQTTAKKSWDLFQISHSLHPAGSSIAADFTTKIPSEGAWTSLGLVENLTEEVHEVRLPELEGRLLALRIRSFATPDRTGAPEAIGFLVRSNLLPDNPEFGLQRTVRVLDEDSKDGGETVWPKGGVDAVRRSLHLLAHRWVTLHEPGVTWSVRVDEVQEVEPSGPIFRETEGEAPRQGYLIQLALAGTRD